MSSPRSLLALSFLLTLPACGVIDSVLGGETDTEGSAETEGAPAPAESGGDGDAADGDGDGDGGGSGIPAPATGLDAYKHWAPVHAFIGSAVIGGNGVGDTDGIVFTKDNHVGVTRDGGQNWTFAKHENGRVLAVAGYPGGLYVAVGTRGYAAVSDDGQHWRDLPRYTSDDLIGVLASDAGIIAVGRKGAFVRYSNDASEAAGGTLPDKFKPKGLAIVSGAVVAFAGKKAYGTGDGLSWARLENAPYLPTGKSYLTSAGTCTIAKVGKNKGVECSVEGTAHGIAANVAAVEKKGMVALTTDGGGTWTLAALPFKSAGGVFGPAGGPYYAVGPRGGVAVSKDGGKSWVDQQWEESANLQAGIVDGTRIIIVGDGATIIHSQDGGNSWDYAEPPIGGSFKYIAKVGGKYVISTGSSAISSADGVTWAEEYDQIPEVPGGSDCEGVPGPGQKCSFYTGTTTPEGLPNVRAFRFSGDSGIATGDAGLVAFSSDGGASWSASSGLDLGSVSAFEAKGQTAIATNGKRIVYSNDGGQTFADAQMPGKYSLYRAFIASDGTAYVAGKSGALLRAIGDHSIFLPVPTAEKNKTTFTDLFEVNGVMYGAGAKGELWRGTADTTWTKIDLGLPAAIQGMTGEGETVMAVSKYGRKTSNYLVRSDDNGEHFYLIGQMSSSSRASDFELKDGKLRYRDRLSDDYGKTWRPAVEWYLGGGVDLADGSGKRILNLGSYSGEDRLMIVGEERNDWLIYDGPYNKGARITCNETTGCWMLAGGTVYRPVG
jgi:photosystem II stability/assembly factor-like uncharacterized protein